MSVKLSRRQAAYIALSAQMLAQATRRKATPQDVCTLVGILGCIQIDTIHVVARSQYIIPWSRFGDYDPAWLDSLQYPQREMYEYWGHAASLIDTSLLPCFLSRMAERREMYAPETYAWTAENLELINHVRKQMELSGPLTTLAFERPDPTQPVEPWAWYGGKPTNRVFDYLWLTGEAGIHRRVNFRREYDLIERVLPQIQEIEQPDTFHERLTLADRALRAMGIARADWLNDYFRTKWGNRNNHPPGPQELLDTLVRQERALPVEITDLGPAYVTVDQYEAMNDALNGATATRTTLLSPFDNLIWDRQRTQELFDFEYRIECYTPAPKRIYGYFTLPVLRRGSLIGRIDPKMDRQTGEFIVRALHFEPGVRLSTRLLDDLRGTLHAFARWNGARSISLDACLPDVAEAVQGPVAR